MLGESHTAESRLYSISSLANTLFGVLYTGIEEQRLNGRKVLRRPV
jgi:hypothetical protein